jgi:hypothetical protein
MPRAEPSSAAEKAPLLVGNPPGSYGAAAHDDSVEAPAPPTASASAAAPRSSTGDDGGERRAAWEGPSRGISEIFRSLPCGEMLRTHGKFLGVLLAVELLILFWALLKPETRCHGQCDWGENDPCTDLKPVHCFPDWRSYFTVGVVLATLGVMSNGTPPDVAMLVATLLLILTKVISREEAYQGLSDPGPLTVACMFIVARALQSVGVIRFLAQALEKVENVSIRLALLWLCLPVVALSAFINNTPIVAALIPLVEEWSGSLDVSPSKLLMPLSFASMLGGMCTLIGTSTNLIVAARYEDEFPNEDRIGLFGPALCVFYFTRPPAPHLAHILSIRPSCTRPLPLQNAAALTAELCGALCVRVRACVMRA